MQEKWRCAMNNHMTRANFEKPRFYRLVGREVYESEWPEIRSIATDYIGFIYISTAFLAIDHNFSFDAQDTVPVLFETMVFGGVFDELQHRYRTLEEAEIGHRAVVWLVQEAYANRVLTYDEV